MTNLYVMLLMCLLFPSVCSAAGAKPNTDAGALLKKAQVLVDKASAATCSRASAVPLYDEPLRLLTEITTRFPQAREENAQAEKLKALCFDRQARYAEKHQTLKRYADLVSGGDTENAAGALIAAADGLLEAEERTEAVVVWRVVATDYPDTGWAPSALLAVARTIVGEASRQGAALLAVPVLKKVIDAYPSSDTAERAHFELADIYCRQPQINNAIDVMIRFADKYPKSKYGQLALHRLSELFGAKGFRVKQKATMEAYLAKYPNGEYANQMRDKLKEVEAHR